MHFQKRMIALSLSLCALSLAGCGTNSVTTPDLYLTGEMFKCRAKPTVPDPETMTDNELAVYLARLEDAGDDCRDQLLELKSLLSVQDGVVITDVRVTAEKEAKQPFWRELF